MVGIGIQTMALHWGQSNQTKKIVLNPRVVGRGNTGVCKTPTARGISGSGKRC